MAPDLLGYLFNRPGGINGLDAFGLFLGYGVEACLDATEEFAIGFFEAVPDRAATGRAAGFTDFHRHAEKQREVGAGIAHGKIDDAADFGHAELPAKSLVGQG